MKLLPISKVNAGMVLGQDLMDLRDERTVLIVRGTVLSKLLIRRLSRWGIRFMIIREPGDPTIMLQNYVKIKKQNPVIELNLQAEAIKSLEEIFDTTSISALDINQNSATIIKHLDSVVTDLVSSLEKNSDMLVNINDLKSYDEYTFHHSLSVAVLTIAVGQYYRFNKTQLHQAGMCAMMHDIGKIAIPIQLIQKTGKLDAAELSLMQTHSSAGFEYLHVRQMADDTLLQGVLYHHEKFDGTGYPCGLKGNQIPLLSRIISVADVYDALTSNRPYRVPMQPSEAIEYIMGSVDSAFDHDTVTAFIRKVDLHPIGSYVELSNKKIAMVLNNENQMRPIIQVMDDGQIIDLQRDRSCYNITITRLFTDALSLQ